MIFDEDIFGDDTLKLVLRYGDHTITGFNNKSQLLPFDKLLSILNGKEKVCYFSKKDEARQIITIPISEEGFLGKVVLYVEWHETNSYEIKANKECKSTFTVEPVDTDSKYFIEQHCSFLFLGLRDQFNDFTATKELYDFKERVRNLEVAPTIIIENERLLWTKYIEAQSLIIDKLQEPFYPSDKAFKLQPYKNQYGDLFRFKLTLPINADLENIIPKAFSDLMAEYSRSFGATINIDQNGYALLNKQELSRVDIMIERKFGSVVSRMNKVTCALKIYPQSTIDQIKHEFDACQMNVFVGYDEDVENFVTIKSGVSGRDILRIPKFILDKYELKLKGIFCQYQKFDEFNHRFFETEKVLFKYPTNFSNLESAVGNLKRKAEAKKQNLEANGDYTRVYISIGQIYSYTKKDIEFDDSFWQSLQADFYGLDIKPSPSDSRLYIEFESFDTFERNFSIIQNNDKFVVAKESLSNPLFRVRFYPTEIQADIDSFEYRKDKIKNVEFVATVTVKDFQKKNVYIGNFNGWESTEQNLVFTIPYKYQEEKKRAADLIKLSKEKSFKIEFVNANLRGEEKKMEWLTEAVQKLDAKRIDSKEPNAKPVNPRLRDFIFDSSKAEPTYKLEKSEKEIVESEEYQLLEKNQLLSLNRSQQLAVLKALYAKDLCLLQGPPGTGKTTVIAELIWQHIINDPTKKLLLTSETNLAVDNALEKLMGSRNVNGTLYPYLSIIKPLRFGRALKFEEDGKKYSVERIEKWLDDEYEDDLVYENESSTLDDAQSDRSIETEGEDDVNNNAVQQWMTMIAQRAQEYSNKNPRYSQLVENYCASLSTPDGITKRLFKEKYFKHANVIGSTCSSTGSPAFEFEYARVFSSSVFEKYVRKGGYKSTINDVLGLLKTSKDEDNDFRTKAFAIVRSIMRENNIKSEDDLIDLLAAPTDNVKHFLFNYELKKLLGPKRIKKFETILERLGFKNEDEFNQLKTIYFDTVIMDEASKATPPDLVLPLCFGKKCIVIGDHRQLPPMLYDQDFKEALLCLQDAKATALAEQIDKEFVETSQFARLILNDKVSSSIKSVFTEQYRMHPQINDVIKQFYRNDPGGLSPGLDLKKVNSSDLSEPESRHHGFYHPGFIDENTHVLWVNVDEPEQRSDSSALYNEKEVEAVKRVLQYLTHCSGFQEYMDFWDREMPTAERRNLEKEIGIISFYGQQVKYLKDVKSFAYQNNLRIKLNTVDKFQGMERNIVIVSTVRSNRIKENNKIKTNKSAGFAESPERLNVALSRARRLLIVVGNSDFFDKVKDREGNLLYHNVIEEMMKHHDIIDYKSLIKYVER